MALTLPATLKLTQLRHLALKCGISSSGTKTVLINRLQSEINNTNTPAQNQKHDTPPPPTKTLSIDMGIRNLAYCILSLPAPTPTPTTPLRKKPPPKPLPQIQAWHRLAVSSAPSLTTDLPPTKEQFDPPTLSRSAYTLLRHRLLLHSPTHILIERQRFRSSSSPHILEWTIRVNMLESILYAVLYTLRAEGVWSGEVVPIMPGKVGPFWVGDVDADKGTGVKLEGKKRKSQAAKVRNKGAKIDLVRRWLVEGGVVGLGSEEVEDMVQAYLVKWGTLPGAPRGKRKVVGETEVGEVEEKMGKLDDLADCLLQGMAWVQWEENKRLVLRDGVEVLLDDMPG